MVVRNVDPRLQVYDYKVVNILFSNMVSVRTSIIKGYIDIKLNYHHYFTDNIILHYFDNFAIRDIHQQSELLQYH